MGSEERSLAGAEALSRILLLVDGLPPPFVVEIPLDGLA
jgi:hypothetical protein